MTKTPQNITVIGAGINGLVAANYTPALHRSCVKL
jgi:predicted NAD/FAD-binding protein